ncbi:hypothetical protein CDAR_92641 [Caerostris darwini]|uniref:C2H2-type domain-containing protein n=1 Tax=Caerostris darwini TaxID=1538125 RepID=A0AAV4TTQ7_9ARAC|nr:hypothetical protein CDAR_92641 [Caerostris darwini]
MEIWNCEFCNAYVTNIEVHYCRHFGNQHHQSSATLPRSSSANWVQDVDSRSTLPMNYEAPWPTTSQINSSTQQSGLPNTHQSTYCEATASAEIPFPYGIANQNQYNPKISDYLFPNIPHGEEYQYKSTPLPVADQHNPMTVAEPCSLPGFQKTFSQRNVLRNQISQYPNASSQMDCSNISRIDETPSHFISDLNESDNASTNRVSQHYQTSSGIPILAYQNVQYNLMDLIPPTDASGPIHSNNCPKEFLPEDHLEPRELSRSFVRPHACSYCDRTFSCSSKLTIHIRTHTGEKPYACKICNTRFADSSTLNSHKRTHTGDNPYACKICNKRFADSSTLTNHIRTHTGEKPYKCTECDMKFSTNSSLKRHMLQHAGEQRRKCDSCGAEFTSEDSLAAHKCRQNK